MPQSREERNQQRAASRAAAARKRKDDQARWDRNRRSKKREATHDEPGESTGEGLRDLTNLADKSPMVQPAPWESNKKHLVPAAAPDVDESVSCDEEDKDTDPLQLLAHAAAAQQHAAAGGAAAPRGVSVRNLRRVSAEIAAAVDTAAHGVARAAADIFLAAISRSSKQVQALVAEGLHGNNLNAVVCANLASNLAASAPKRGNQHAEAHLGHIACLQGAVTNPQQPDARQPPATQLAGMFGVSAAAIRRIREEVSKQVALPAGQDGQAPGRAGPVEEEGQATGPAFHKDRARLVLAAHAHAAKRAEASNVTDAE